MFENLIYAIASLIIATTYTPGPDPLTDPASRMLGIVMACSLFLALVFFRDRLLLLKASPVTAGKLDRDYRRSQLTYSGLSLLVFAFIVHGLDLPRLLCPAPVAQALPTIRDALSLSVYFLLLNGIWFSGYRVFTRLNPFGISRKEYLKSQLAMSAPALLPWVGLSGFHDLLLVLPSPSFHSLLTSEWGQTLYFVLIFSAIFILSPLGIRRFWGCKPLGHGPERSRIESLCERTGTGFRDILIWPVFGGRMLTAGVMGPVGRYRYILVTPALLESVTPDELDAVIAHEIGHVKRHHLFLYVFILFGFVFVSWSLLDFIHQLVLLSPGFALLLRLFSLEPETLSLAYVITTTIVFFALYFRFIFGFFMRNFERQADAFAFQTQKTARHLTETFRKIVRFSGQDPDRPNWHHFGISERIAFLSSCETQPEIARKHDLRIRLFLFLYLAGIVMAGGLGWVLKTGETGLALQRNLVIRGVERQLGQSPDNPVLLRYLGDLLQEKGAYERAVQAYTKGLSLYPQSREILNNLAWLYITVPDPSIADPLLGTYLAEKAARNADAPHIWDTLAEGYFRSGRKEDAVRAARRAIGFVTPQTPNAAYYNEQLKRFLKASGTTDPAASL